jgi:hypothetical protein
MPTWMFLADAIPHTDMLYLPSRQLELQTISPLLHDDATSLPPLHRAHHLLNRPPQPPPEPFQPNSTENPVAANVPRQTRFTRSTNVARVAKGQEDFKT